MKRLLALLLLLSVRPGTGAEVWVEAERFDDRGGWVLDQQFMDLMGSPYLLAHGMGRPVEDAVTTVHFPEAGRYRLYVRTFNWTAPWYEGRGPGRFEVRVNGRTLKAELGCAGSSWMWQDAGTVDVSDGETIVALHDLTGFDGRCDALYFTTERGAAPPAGGAALEVFRRRMSGVPDEPAAGGTFDLVVVGGGIAGMCAAVSAARLGCRVALVHDRPVLGGNNSSEVRVHLGGHSEIGPYPALGRMLREFGHSREGNARPAEWYEDDKKARFIASEPNVTLFAECRAVGVRLHDAERIAGVVIRHTSTGCEQLLAAPLFADCTGDGALGVLAGAEWHMGRDPKSRYGEPSAPDEADGITLGASVQWYCLEADAPRPFPDIDWGLPIDERTVQKVRRGQWYWEVGMVEDQMAQAERIRDYGMYVVYSNWSYIKNRASFRDEYAASYLGWVAHVAGKRESRRLVGEFVLREQDLVDFTIYPDGCVSTSWYIDNHEPDPENSRHFREPWLSRGCLRPLDFYPIPYRCFYSKDLDNLFMAGRDISVSHIALGTTRVMRTTAMMGEVVGLAASLCDREGLLPRDIYEKAFDRLRDLMKRGAGRTDVPYMQVYTLIDTTAARSEEC